MGSHFYSSEDFERRGFELYDKGCYERALEIFRAGVKKFPTIPDLYEGLGDCYLELGEYALAARGFEQGLAYAPENVAMLAGLGAARIALGKPQAAVRCFTRVLDIGTDDVETLVTVARNLYEIEMFEEAIECCTQALALDPACADASFCKAASLSCLGADLAETEPLFKAALDVETREDMVCYYANILYENRQYRKALHVFESVPAEDIADTISLERMIKLYGRFKDKQREIARCRRQLGFLLEQTTFDGFARSFAEEWKQNEKVKNKDGQIL